MQEAKLCNAISVKQEGAIREEIAQIDYEIDKLTTKKSKLHDLIDTMNGGNSINGLTPNNPPLFSSIDKIKAEHWAYSFVLGYEG